MDANIKQIYISSYIHSVRVPILSITRTNTNTNNVCVALFWATTHRRVFGWMEPERKALCVCVCYRMTRIYIAHTNRPTDVFTVVSCPCICLYMYVRTIFCMQTYSSHYAHSIRCGRLHFGTSQTIISRPSIRERRVGPSVHPVMCPHTSITRIPS